MISLEDVGDGGEVGFAHSELEDFEWSVAGCL